MQTAERPEVADVPVVTVVHAPACHFCHDAEVSLIELAATYPMRIERIDVRTDTGQALLIRHRPALNPLVLVDGVYFSAGRLPRRKLERLLDRRTAMVARGR